MNFFVVCHLSPEQIHQHVQVIIISIWQVRQQACCENVTAESCQKVLSKVLQNLIAYWFLVGWGGKMHQNGD